MAFVLYLPPNFFYLRLQDLQLSCLQIAAVRTDHDAEVARLEDIFKVVIVELKHFRSDGERNLAALSGFKSNALEALQFFHGTAHARYEVAYVELDNLSGIRVATPQKGIFIKNGKKVIIK